MTDKELVGLWKAVKKAARQWGRKARSGTLSPPRFQRPAIWAIGPTYIGALWPLWALPEDVTASGVNGNRRFVHEDVSLLRWYPIGVDAEFLSESFTGEINQSVPGPELAEFEAYRRSSISLLPDFHFSEADGEKFAQLERIWTTKAKPVATLTEYNRVTLWPSSGVTYAWEIVGERFLVQQPQPGFKTVDLASVERWYPMLLRCEWSLPDDGSPLVPKVVSTRARVKGCCLCK